MSDSELDEERSEDGSPKPPPFVRNPDFEVVIDPMDEEWEWPVIVPENDSDEEEDDDDMDAVGFDDAEEPYIKFRRVARAVKMLIGVCHACRSLLCTSVAAENWFALLDNLVAATTLQQSQKKGRAFVALVPNEKRQLEQLTFDINDYKQQKQSKDLFTDEIRAIMKKGPDAREPDEIMEVVRAMKGMSKAFREYPLPIQKQICQRSFYDKYHHNRVIIRRALHPDGIYFVISGTLISKPEGKRNTEEIQTGEKFGEEDLICGCTRRTTILTRHEVELLFLHRFTVNSIESLTIKTAFKRTLHKSLFTNYKDYMDIFDMSADSNDPKNLNICTRNTVLRHFPIQKLESNPGTWSTLKYRYGRLMVKNSNEVEWIFVILSGEARVIAHLEPDTIDVKARRKQIQKAMEQESPYYKKKRLLNFVSDRAYVKSSYNPAVYHPTNKRENSAPPTYGHRKCLDDICYRIIPETPRVFPTMTGFLRSKSEMGMQTEEKTKLPEIQVDNSGENEDNTGNKESDVTEEVEIKGEISEDTETTIVTIEELKISADTKKPFYQKTGRGPLQQRPHSENLKTASVFSHDSVNRSTPMTNQKTSITAREKKRLRLKFLNAPIIKPKQAFVNSARETSEKTELPAFVQVETLHPGQTFGLRSCLEPHERGPAVSLVSGDCEVLALNKKFFLRHCDDAMFSLIKLKAKPFPDQKELVDRLDITLKWDEFKQETLKDFLNRKIRKH